MIKSTQSQHQRVKPPRATKAAAQQRGLVYLMVYLCFFPMIARADVVDTLNNFLGYLTGGVGKAIAGLAIVGIGFGCFGLGKIPKGYVIAVVVGVGIVFGAKAILNMLGG